MKKKGEHTTVDPNNARDKNYQKLLEKCQAEGTCPFCPISPERNPTLKEINGWVITTCNPPYKEADKHFLLVPKKHITSITDLLTDDLIAIKDGILWLIKEYSIPGGGITMRFGDTKYAGSTVVHLHVHLFVTKLKDDQSKAIPIYFPIG